MPNVTFTPNMNLPEPVVGQDPGPEYANYANAGLTLIDQHNHSPGYGVLINPNGLNINSDLTFNSQNAIALRSARFTNQSAPLALVTDLNCVYSAGTGGDLYYNDGSGNQIQITASGAVRATISALVSGLNQASFVANQLVVLSNSSNNTPANIKGASVLLGNNVSNSNYLTLQPPNAMASNYSLTLPSLPSSTELLQIDNVGNITASGISPNALNPPGTITMYGGVSAPTGYLLCDGTSYLQSAYPALFAAIGTAYGSADGTHFNVPDMRGMFPRGVSGTSGNDPDASSRVVNGFGGNVGNNVGSQQSMATEAHAHTITTAFNSNGSDGFATSANNSGGLHSMSTGTYGSSSETRPINVYVNFIIKT